MSSTANDSKWIDVKNLPKTQDDILVAFSTDTLFMAKYQQGEWWLYYSDVGLRKADEYHTSKIHHWQPLPEPPQQSKQK